MRDRRVLITGATSGIGRETAISLAKMGASVVFTSRDAKRGIAARDYIRKASENRYIEVMECDLASFDSIRSFCASFKAMHKSLHVLINNAGIWNFSRRESKDTIEETFAVNYLAPFLMTELLLDILKTSAPSRIINVSSGLHSGTINFNDIEFRNSYSGLRAYAQSKLALILFTRSLSEKLAGTGVSVNALHPGFIATNLGRDAGRVSRRLFTLFGKNPRRGSETSVYLASAPQIENVTGEYFVNKKIGRASRESCDAVLAQKLWDFSMKYVD